MSIESIAYSAVYRNATRPEFGDRRLRREMMVRIWRFARPHHREIYGYIALSAVAAVLTVATPLLAGRVVDAIVSGTSRSAILWLAAAIAGVAIAEAGARIATTWVSSRLGEGTIVDLRRAVFDHVQTMPVAFFTRTRTGALVSRLNNDVIGAQRAFSDTLSGVVANLITLLLTLAIMLTLSWQITLAALLLLPVFVVPAQRMGGRIAELAREASRLNAVMSTSMTERFSAPGATLIKLFGDTRRESAAFAAHADAVAAIGVRRSMTQGVFVTLLTLASALALALVYGIGGVLAAGGGLEAGTVVAMALLLTRLYAPLTALAGARMEIMSAVVSFERVFEVLDLPPLIADRPGAIEFPALTRRQADSAGSIFAGRSAVGLTFDAVDFTYPGAEQVSLASLEDVARLDDRPQREVLHGVDFHAAPGTTTAIVGSSGAGKSTIASLATRLYDVDTGTIRLGDTDIRDVSLASLHRAVGLVTQDGHLFHDTVRANLLLADPDATDDELWESLRRARLDHVIATLPDGLDTVVGERGYRLSGGERQRLTIARVLLTRPAVVVLDEATAHLDTDSEAAVHAALTEALTGRTAIVIAHRLSTVVGADQILVLEDGRIVERGTHRQLLAKGGRYRELYESGLRDPA